VLEAFPATPLMLELKTESPRELADAVAATLAHHGRREDVMVVSFSTAYLQRFRDLMPDVPTGCGNSEIRSLVILHYLQLHHWYRPRCRFLLVPERVDGVRILTPRFLRAAERLGLKVHVWTINQVADMKRLMDMGVDAILTDYPDRLVPLVRPVAVQVEEPATQSAPVIVPSR
jgi:glycerophosphoryl diester phosphodiesterase